MNMVILLIHYETTCYKIIYLVITILLLIFILKCSDTWGEDRVPNFGELGTPPFCQGWTRQDLKFL